MRASTLPVLRASHTVFERDDWRLSFNPLFRQGDMQTIAGRYWPAALDEQRWPSQSRFFQTEPDTQVLGRLNLQSNDTPVEAQATVLSVHGLTASDHAPYMLSSGQLALEAGFDLVRLNVRNCGGTEHLSPTLYHSGLTTDLRQVVEQLAPRPLFLLGFSMGGNMVLKLAGEWGENPPPHVRAVSAISPPIRLDACSLRIGESRNWVYEQRFVRQLRATMRRKATVIPETYPQPDFSGVNSIWKFDDKFTAPAFGFQNAAHYYEQCSCAGFLDQVRVPSLVIQAHDDPYIPFEVFRDSIFDANPWINLLAESHGGHVAFLAKGAQRFWAQEQAMRFFDAVNRY